MLLSMRKTSDILWQDAQHQVLFEILDLIDEPDAGPEIVQRLQRYTESHFELEEHYMQVLDYPAYGEHKRAHDQFRDEIDSLLHADQQFNEQLGTLVATYLRAWLKGHVFGSDKELEAFILASSVK